MLIRSFAVVLVLSASVPALAQEVRKDPKLECVSCRTYPMSFVIGSQMFKGAASGGAILRVDGYFGFMFTWRPWLIIGANAHIGRTWFTYGANINTDQAGMMKKATDPMTNVKVDLSTKGYITIEPIVQVRAHEFDFRKARTRLSFWVYGLFETQLNLGDELNINTVTLETTGANPSTLDLTPYLREDPSRLKMYYSWNRYELGAIVRVEWRDKSQRERFSFSAQVGWQRLDSKVTIFVDQATRDLVTAAGLDPRKIEGSRPLQYDAPILIPGFTVRLWRELWMHASGMAIPVGGAWYGGYRSWLEWRINP